MCKLTLENIEGQTETKAKLGHDIIQKDHFCLTFVLSI
jgi:hypothetical protein